MAQFSRTWWGKRFIEALEEFTDSARLGRGRSMPVENSNTKLLKQNYCREINQSLF